LYFKCPYQAKVMNRFDASSSATGVRRSIHMEFEDVKETVSVTHRLHGPSTFWKAIFTKLKELETLHAGHERRRAGPDRGGQPQYFRNGRRVPRRAGVRGGLCRRRPGWLPLGDGEQL